ncbi:MAG: class I SAM-dependent methyltransferase [Chitinophagia bacterium]|nr:class I SAM-dependent methyltransferase [Chitinophagia bacterium]
MALHHHSDHKARFQQQIDNSQEYVFPFIEATHSITSASKVLEVGTGEGGVLVPFIEKGAYSVGVDLAPERIDLANEFLAKEVATGKALFLCQNIYDSAFISLYSQYFDVIILKDVIEHVYEQDKFIAHLKTLLRPGGQIFFGFPPWQMPFGGHQQVCRTKWVSKLPYYHLFPIPIFKAILRWGGEDDNMIKEMLEVKATGISIERFERIIKQTGLKVLKKQHYLINPIYKYKFGLEPRKQLGIIVALPYLRNFLTTCVYYTVG